MPLDKRKVLLTGIGGSIGIHTFAHIMHNTDWYVVGIDSFRHKGWQDRIAEVLDAHPDWRKRLTLITRDLRSPITTMTKKEIGYVDIIINMASLSDVEASIQDPVGFITNNIDLEVNILEFARDNWGLDGAEKPPLDTAFVQISTDEIYGPTDGKTAHPEWAPILPSNPYAASKAAQEAIAISYWRSYNLPLIITNTMNNFGEMQQDEKYPVKIQKAIEAGETVTIHGPEENIGSRFYLHSRNFADALVFIIKQGAPFLHAPGEVDRPDRYNIVGDKQLSNLELAKTIGELMGKPDFKYKIVDFHATRPGHDKHYGLDGTKLKELGWKAPLTFEESLKNTIDWQRENRKWIGDN